MKVWFESNGSKLVLFIKLSFYKSIIDKVFVQHVDHFFGRVKVLAFNEDLCRNDTVLVSDYTHSVILIKYGTDCNVYPLLKYPSKKTLREILSNPKNLVLKYYGYGNSIFAETFDETNYDFVELNTNFKELNKELLSKNLEELGSVEEKITWQLGKLLLD